MAAGPSGTLRKVKSDLHGVPSRCPGAPMDHAQPHSWPARNWSTMPGLGFRVVAPESNRQTWNHGSTTAIVCRKMSTLSTLARTTPAAATTRMTACSSASVERTITSPLSGVANNTARCVIRTLRSVCGRCQMIWFHTVKVGQLFWEKNVRARGERFPRSTCDEFWGILALLMLNLNLRAMLHTVCCSTCRAPRADRPANPHEIIVSARCAHSRTHWASARQLPLAPWLEFCASECFFASMSRAKLED